MVHFARKIIMNKPDEGIRLVITAFVGIVFGLLIGLTLSNTLRIAPGIYPFRIYPTVVNTSCIITKQEPTVNCTSGHIIPSSNNSSSHNLTDPLKIWVPSNPRGAERLPPSFVESESDFYLRRLWGKPSEDLKSKPKYLVTFTVGYKQKKNIDAAVKKFSDDFQLLLFHYDGKTTDWDEYEWSKKAIHISARKQAKWWFAKRFLHPDIVAAYEYIFIWDEDLGLEHFKGEEYIKVVKKHGLEISQPGVETRRGSGPTWKLTERRSNSEVHKTSHEVKWKCKGPHHPPCGGFVEIMAPVFSREAWRCVWHMIQNDLVHGWGLDFELGHCVEPAHEKIGVVDSQWIIHQGIPSLDNQGVEDNGKFPREGVYFHHVKKRCHVEWEILKKRLEDAKKAYYKSRTIDNTPNGKPAIFLQDRSIKLVNRLSEVQSGE